MRQLTRPWRQHANGGNSPSTSSLYTHDEKSVTNIVRNHLKRCYYEYPWLITALSIVSSAIGLFLTFVLVVEDFLHQHEEHSDGFVLIELVCDFIFCTHIAIIGLYYGPQYFQESISRFAEPIVAFLCITSLYVYEATARADRGLVSAETVIALDFFRDFVRVARLLLFMRMMVRHMNKYAAMTSIGEESGLEPSDIGSVEVNFLSDIGVQLQGILPRTTVDIKERHMPYEEIPGHTISNSSVSGRLAVSGDLSVTDDRTAFSDGESSS